MVRQDSNYQTGKYTILDVDVDCVRLSKFIETKLNCRYEDGKAFYEVTEDKFEDHEETDAEEDLLYCRKILRPKKNEVFVRQLCITVLCCSCNCCMMKIPFSIWMLLLYSSVVGNWNCSHSLNTFTLFLEHHPWQSNQDS